MNIFRHFEKEILAIAQELTGEEAVITCEAPKDASHGDLATNVAMVLAKKLGENPKNLAEKIAEKISKLDKVEKVEIAGPGFINLRLEPKIWVDRIADIIKAKEKWGASDIGKGIKVNVEYVSANPTGPLHAAHARGAIIGDSLAALLEKAGYEVKREYYINDSGAQVDMLARSGYLRYCEALGEKISIADSEYPGEYLKEVGEKLAEAHGKKWLNKSEEEWLEPIRSFTIEMMLASIKADLERLGIKMDVFTSEKALLEKGAVAKSIELLTNKNLIYEGTLPPPKGKTSEDWEPREQTLFRSSDFGDDSDRAVKKSDGNWTYFANDVAYHMDKLERGADLLINIWGADHGGYVKRMQAAVEALSGRKDALDIRLCQLVKLSDGGKPIKMSKRAGTFITLADVLDNVGKDILRFIMLTRRPDQALDFDYEKVKEQSKDNPVFYVQYAHARLCSVLRQVEFKPSDKLHLDLLGDEAEMDLIKHLASWHRVIETAAKAREPHRIAFYLQNVASAFHGLWHKGRDDSKLRFIVEGNTELTSARSALIFATRIVMRQGLEILGVEAPEEM